MDKGITNLIKDSASTFLNIAQMMQSRMKYVIDGDPEDKKKMYKHAYLASAGIVCLFMIGIAGLIESR